MGKQTKQARRETARQAAQRRQGLRWGAVALVALTIGAYAVLSGGSGNQALALAPDFELETTSGEPVKLSDFKGQPVALTFMHTY